MTESVSLVLTLPVDMALGAIFILVLVVAHKAIADMSFFGNTSGWIVATCVAALGVVGLVRFFGSAHPAASLAHAPHKGDGMLDILLLPYVALTLVVLLLLALRMVWPGTKSGRPNAAGTSPRIEDHQHAKKKDDRTKIASPRRPARGQTSNRSIKT
jgi:hypothetical protein